MKIMYVISYVEKKKDEFRENFTKSMAKAFV